MADSFASINPCHNGNGSTLGTSLGRRCNSAASFGRHPERRKRAPRASSRRGSERTIRWAEPDSQPRTEPPGRVPSTI